jgi:hypothetical protein
MIEASADTVWRRKLVKCSPVPFEAVGYPIYRPRGCLEDGSWLRTVRRRLCDPVDGMA